MAGPNTVGPITADTTSRLKAVQTAYQNALGLAELVQGAQGGANVLLYAWSSTSLAWQVVGVDASGNLLTTGAGGGGGGLTDTQLRAAAVAVSLPALAEEMEYDGSGNLIYFGQAVPGTGLGAAFWAIRKLAYDGSGNLLSLLWANGSSAFNSAWTGRAGLSYS